MALPFFPATSRHWHTCQQFSLALSTPSPARAHRTVAIRNGVVSVYRAHTHTLPPHTRNSSPSIVSRRSSLPTNKGSRPKRFGYKIITALDPQKLVPEDYIDTARRLNLANLEFRPAWLPRFRSFIRQLPPVRHDASLPASDRFPRGFLYYHSSLNQPPLAASIRFRLTPSDDPSTFAAGRDLLTSQTLPWMIPLLSIARNSNLQAFRAILENDGLVSNELMQLATQNGLYRFCVNGDRRISTLIHSFHQPFPIAVDKCNTTFNLVSKKGMAPYRKFNTRDPTLRPLQGTAICCFERSALEKHSGKRGVVIRILRSLESDPLRPNPAYAGVPFTKEILGKLEGSLLSAIVHQKRHNRSPWSVNVDDPQSHSQSVHPLHILFDNEAEYGPFTDQF